MLATATILSAFALIFAAAIHTPRDAAGNPLCRGKRSLTGDIASVLGLS
jgi:hypothetical protein